MSRRKEEEEKDGPAEEQEEQIQCRSSACSQSPPCLGGGGAFHDVPKVDVQLTPAAAGAAHAARHLLAVAHIPPLTTSM